MKKLLFLLLLIPFLGNSQATFTAPVGYNTGAPTATPSGVGTRWRFDLLTGKKYTWLPGSLSWDEDARGIDQVAGCSAPLYTPGYNQSTFAVNSCTVPELYQWTGAAWVRLNEGEVYTAGTGISISGGNEISNTAPDQTVTMTDGTGIDVTGTYPNFTVTNTSPNVVQTLSIAGQDLTLSNGGGTVAIPAGASDALGTGFTSGGGSGTIPAGTTSVTGFYNWAFDGAAGFNYNEGTILNNIYLDDRGLGISSFDSSIPSGGTLSASPYEFNFAMVGGTIRFDAQTGATIRFQENAVDLTFSQVTDNVIFTDGRATPRGIEYAAYYPDIETNDPSLTSTQNVNSLKQKLVTYTTTQRNAIPTPATGYVIYNTDATATDGSTGVMQVWNGSTWKNAW